MNQEKPDPTINVLHIVELTKQHILAVVDLHIHYQKELREAEAKRIDAIRAVDVAAVASANEKAIQQANVLATQLVATAESLNKRITNVEREQYEKQGTGTGQKYMWQIVFGILTLAVAVYLGLNK